jgi:hypothetical protein
LLAHARLAALGIALTNVDPLRDHAFARRRRCR